MVLKRFVITALGALGLGALAAGPTFAQQIPAPDAYGDPQACAADVLEKEAADAIAAAAKGEVGDNGLTVGQTNALTVIMARACAGDVGGGIAMARTLYERAVIAAAELAGAEKVYEADDSAGNLEKRDEARTAHMEAVAARNAYSDGGSIYEAVYAEEDSLAEATAALSAYEKAETAAAAALVARDAAEYKDYINDFAGFDTTTGQAYEYEVVEYLTTPDNPEMDGDQSVYTPYVQVKRQGGAVVAPEKDADGNIIPPTLSIGDGTEEDRDADLVLLTNTTVTRYLADGTTEEIIIVTASNRSNNPVREATKTLSALDMEYKTAKMNLETATKNLDDNQDGSKTTTLAETKRRAQARYDFFAAQKASAEADLAAGELLTLRAALGEDDLDTPDIVEDEPHRTLYTVEEYEGLTDLQDAQTDAADALKAAYDARVAATNDVEKNQRNTGAYLAQLVKLRTGQKDAADAAAADDATELTAAQETANEKLATAEAQLASYNALQALDDANPVKALVTSLLKAKDSDGDDDGQALVDAISSNYEAANDAADTANAAMEAVEGLSGDAGMVAENTAAIDALTAEDGPITENADGIVDLDGRVSGNENTLADHDMKLMAKKAYIDAIGAEMGFDAATGLGIGEDDMSRIDMNEAGVEANSTAITAETAARMEADTALDGRIDAEALAREAADIALDGRIDTEASAREMADTALGGRIDTEASAREMADTALGGRIDAEETARMAADTMLGGLIDNEEAARMSADVAEETARMAADAVEEAARMEADTMLHGMIGSEETARMSADTMLDGLVASNTASISSNADNIAANMNSIGSNSASIADNRNMIGELSDDLSVVRAGVAASMALAGMPAINGRGISIGVGSFDGESAFAVGFQIQGEMASFKIGLTSGGGATGASAGVGFQF